MDLFTYPCFHLSWSILATNGVIGIRVTEKYTQQENSIKYLEQSTKNNQ